MPSAPFATHQACRSPRRSTMNVWRAWPRRSLLTSPSTGRTPPGGSPRAGLANHRVHRPRERMGGRRFGGGRVGSSGLVALVTDKPTAVKGAQDAAGEEHHDSARAQGPAARRRPCSACGCGRSPPARSPLPRSQPASPAPPAISCMSAGARPGRRARPTSCRPRTIRYPRSSLTGSAQSR